MGEISGKLPLIFDYLGQMERARLKALKSIQKALIYPIVVLIVAIVVLLFILMVIVPTFELLYQSGGVELPKVTQKVLALSQFLLSRSGMWLLFYLLLLLGGLRFFYRRESGFRYRLDGYVLRMPLIGPILLASFNARFSQVVGMMLGAGIPLVKSIELYSAGLNNQYIQKQLRALIEALKRGDSLYNVAKSSQLFTAVALTLISVGEMSGTLVTVLERSGQYHTDIVMQRVEAFIALIDPLSLLLIGGVVGVILIALYLPLFTLGMAI